MINNPPWKHLEETDATNTEYVNLELRFMVKKKYFHCVLYKRNKRQLSS